MPSCLSQRVYSLMRGDRVEPGAYGSAVFVQSAFQVNLKKRVLELWNTSSASARSPG
jgi:hypothetical protein